MSTVTRRLKEILARATEKIFWIHGHLTSVKTSSTGHLFGELAEIDSENKTIAKIGVTIWDSDLAMIQEKLKRHGPPRTRLKT